MRKCGINAYFTCKFMSCVLCIMYMCAYACMYAVYVVYYVLTCVSIRMHTCGVCVYVKM